MANVSLFANYGTAQGAGLHAGLGLLTSFAGWKPPLQGWEESPPTVFLHKVFDTFCHIMLQKGLLTVPNAPTCPMTRR